MRRLLLTSAGLTDRTKQIFFEQISKAAQEIKIIIVPCASTVNDEAREGISMALTELINMGIVYENITIYNLNYVVSKDHERKFPLEICSQSLFSNICLWSAEELLMYDAILFTGGDAKVLLNEVNRTGFNVALKTAIENGLFYFGVSAGSMIAARNLPENLGYLPNIIIPHCVSGSPCGDVNNNADIHLTNEQAVWIEGNHTQIIM